MDSGRIGHLLKLISELVNEKGGTWNGKRAQVLLDISEEERSDLEEFVSWFSPAET